VSQTDEERRSGDDADTSEDGGRMQQAEQGAESYGDDPDAGPSVTEDEVERGLDRDQAEG
jgi:hypothetical protein